MFLLLVTAVPWLAQDVLYVDATDLRRVGVEDPAHLSRLMVGVRHVIVPDKMLQDNRCSAVVQSGRLVVDIFQYLDYATMIRMTRVCKLWRFCLNKGVRKLTISNPVRLGAPVKQVLCQFSSLTDLNGETRHVLFTRAFAACGNVHTLSARTVVQASSLGPRALLAWLRASHR